MAWSPPALERRSWLVEQAGDYAAPISHHIRDGTQVANIRTESISRACRSKITALLGQERAAEFGRLYNARSRFAHHGAGRSMLHEEGGVAQRLATDALMAELQRRSNDSEGERS